MNSKDNELAITQICWVFENTRRRTVDSLVRETEVVIEINGELAGELDEKGLFFRKTRGTHVVGCTEEGPK